MLVLSDLKFKWNFKGAVNKVFKIHYHWSPFSSFEDLLSLCLYFILLQCADISNTLSSISFSVFGGVLNAFSAISSKSSHSL